MPGRPTENVVTAAPVTQTYASAADFTEPSWVKSARQTIGTDVEPVYPMKTVHGGNQEPDTSKAPIGYRYDNGKSQYQYLDLAGKPTNLVNRGNLGEAIKTLAPIGLSMIGANFLAPALGDLFGTSATLEGPLADLMGTTSTNVADLGMGGLAGTGAVVPAAAINQAVAAGTFTPGNLVEVASKYGLTTPELLSSLTPEALAATSGVVTAGSSLADIASLTPTGTAPTATPGTTPPPNVTPPIVPPVAPPVVPPVVDPTALPPVTVSTPPLPPYEPPPLILPPVTPLSSIAPPVVPTTVPPVVPVVLPPTATPGTPPPPDVGPPGTNVPPPVVVPPVTTPPVVTPPVTPGLLNTLTQLTGLTGTQLAALLSGITGLGNSANLISSINTGLDATTAANTASQGVLKDIYNQQLGFQKPYQAAGTNALSQLGALGTGQYQQYDPATGQPTTMGTGSGYLQHQFDASDLAKGLAPNYDFMLQQGQMANQRAANVGGGALSGNTLQGLQNYTQNYAGNAYQNAFNNYQSQRQNIYGNLASMAGIGQTANTGAQAAGTSYGKGTTDLQTALANAQAAASIGKAQAAAQGTSGLANSTFLASLLAPPK